MSERFDSVITSIQSSRLKVAGMRSLQWRRQLRFAALAIGAFVVFANPWRYLFSETPSVLQLSEYEKREWQIEDGLPENNVRMIAQRPDGTLLLATSAGIASFDGRLFQPLPIGDAGNRSAMSDNEAVNAIFPDGNENLWIGTDGRGVIFQTPSGSTNISEKSGLFNERIRAFYRDASGVIWVATQNGVERYVDGRLVPIRGTGMISGDITTPFAEDGHGGMFYITSIGLFHWRNGVAHRYLLQLPASETPTAAYRDPQKRIWVGTMKHVVLLVPRNSDSWEGQPAFDEEVRANVGAPVSVLLGDASGSLWIGTRREGMFRLNSSGLSRWNSRNGLADDAIRTMFIDDEQDLWIGMLAGGLSRWRKGALAPYGAPEGFPGTYSANALADSRGDLWLGTWGKGLFVRRKGELIPMTLPSMPIATPIRALAEDRKGEIWVGTWFNGVYRYDGRGFTHYYLGIESPGNAVSAILAGRNGGLWIGTYTGLFFFPNGVPDRTIRQQFLSSQLITCLLEDKDGSILVGTSMGLYRVLNGNASPIPALAHAHILSLTMDSEGYAWATTKGGGIAAIRQNDAAPIPAIAGLSNISVNTGVEDRDGHLWFGTTRGIVRVSVSELHQVVDGQRTSLSIMTFDKADGMRSSECDGPSQPSSTRLPDGTLWFATAKGFVHTTDVSEKLGSISPTANIAGWSPSIDPNSPDLTPTASNSRIDLEPGHSDLLVFFTGKMLSNPSHLEFRYRLAGYDTDWTMTRARVARYRRLPPGKYTFQVQARASGEQWSSPISSLIVDQRPYLYQTWYFYLAIVLLAAAVSVYLFRLRVRRMKGRMGIVLDERNRIARECHDSLMAGFAAVSWQLEATAKLFRDSGSESTPPAESCELARSMVAHCQAEARRIIWDLRDTDEVTGMLSHALTRSLSANPAPDTIESSFYVYGAEVPLAPGCVHQLVCIGQEAVKNAVRHAQATRIAVSLRYESDSLTLTVSDNGRGFLNSGIAASLSGHFGISVMEERARKLGSTLRLETAPGAGTEVTVRVGFNAMIQSVKEQRPALREIEI